MDELVCWDTDGVGGHVKGILDAIFLWYGCILVKENNILTFFKGLPKKPS